MVYLTNPGLRTLDAVNPESDDVKMARSGGVTTALLIPGSGTNMSGFGTIVKFAGRTVDEMVLKSPGSLKIAQAGNPERYWYGVGRSFMNYNTRQTLQKALAYHRAWEAFEAALKGSREIGFTIVSITFSLIAVLWVVYGYSLAFTEGNAFVEGPTFTARSCARRCGSWGRLESSA